MRSSIGVWGNGDNRKNNLICAGYNYDEIQAKVNELLGQDKYYSACSSNFVSLVEALRSIGVDCSFENRKKIAIKNGVKEYTGTAVQNIRLLDKLKSGRLLK